ncbi:NrpR regulatory domain-containing protein [bacterium]|nr:NrpR regulatory domain-containing protein [bacterium]
MSDKTEKKRLSILRILQDSEKCLSSSKITRQLQSMGYDISGRTVRLYLMKLDREGLTNNHGKRGRRITDLGVKELSNAKVYEKIGLMAAKIDQLTYQMNFNLLQKSGSVVINISMLAIDKLLQSVPLIKNVFEAGYAMGKLLALFGPGERVGELSVPEGFVGIGTVCSVTLNGVLLTHGIPTNSRFGGLLEIQDKHPTRFVELIHYEGTTLDPLEIFIRSGMTDYIGATTAGNGRIGAGFREIPADSRDQVIKLAQQLKKIGLGGFLAIGWPGQPLLDIPVSEGRAGIVVIGGLNPIAILEENGLRLHSHAMASLVDYQSLFSFKELNTRICDFI